MKSTILAIITALVLVIALFVVMRPVETKILNERMDLIEREIFIGKYAEYQ